MSVPGALRAPSPVPGPSPGRLPSPTSQGRETAKGAPRQPSGVSLSPGADETLPHAFARKGAAVLRISRRGRVIVASQALANLLGYTSPAEIMEQSAPDLSYHLDPADWMRVTRLVRAGPPYGALQLLLRRRHEGHVWAEVLARPAQGDALRAGAPVIDILVRALPATV